MKSLPAVALAAVLLFSFGCVPIAVSQSEINSAGRRQANAQEQIAKANASATGYEIGQDRMDEFVALVFDTIEATPAPCWMSFPGVSHCAEFTPKYDPWAGATGQPDLEDRFSEVLPHEIGDALELGPPFILPADACPWTRGDGSYWKLYVLDGMQVIRIHRARDRLAVVFEPPDAPQD